MLGEEKNLKDSQGSRHGGTYGAGTQEMSVSMSYNKTNKLITALYIVTDIMDEQEPLRLKLRTLGVETLSDIISSQRTGLVKKIQGILSLLDIALTMNMITEMNKNILAGEFTKLKNSLVAPQDNPLWLEEFLRESPVLDEKIPPPRAWVPSQTRPLHKDRRGGGTGEERGNLTHLGVQKGSTLMKAIKDMSDRMPNSMSKTNFDLLKKQRREEIKNTIKNNGDKATIKDIRTKIVQGSALHKTSEKTLQRELISMTKEGVLYKTGEKRWTQYSLK